MAAQYRKTLFELHPALADLWHPDNVMAPDSVTASSAVEVMWLCPNGHPPYTQKVRHRVDNHRNGNTGCGDCKRERIRAYREKPLPGRSLSDLYPEVAQLWHLGNTKTAKEVKHGSEYVAMWTCTSGHPDYARVVCDQVKTYRNRGVCCPQCFRTIKTRTQRSRHVFNKKVIRPNTALVDTYPELVDMWHPSNELLPSEVSYGSKSLVEWICLEGHGTYIQPVNARVKAHKAGRNGCLVCGRLKVGTKNAEPPLGDSLGDHHPELIPLWGAGNESTPFDFSRKSGRKALWKCPSGHPDYSKTIYKRVYAAERGNTACPKCPRPTGVDPNKPSVLYLIFNPTHNMLKVGISSELEGRMRRHRTNGFEKVVGITREMDTDVAYALEQTILAALKDSGALFAPDMDGVEPFDGYTECWVYDSFPV